MTRLSRAISSTGARTAAVVRGRPGFWRGQVQRRRTRHPHATGNRARLSAQ